LTALQPVTRWATPSRVSGPVLSASITTSTYDSSFTYICTPNDTHGCRVRAFVRNGVVMRVEQNYDHQTMRTCTATRGRLRGTRGMCLIVHVPPAVYGPYRLKGPMLRKGWKAGWTMAVRS